MIIDEKSYTSSDGARIDYWKAGEGELLICLHGSGESRTLWERTGWIEKLTGHYTVIAPDLRGFGHSTVFHDPEHYRLDCILDDISGIAAEYGFSKYRLFAHSYGATIAYQAVRAGLPITRAVCASGSMGSEFFHQICPAEQEEYQMLSMAKKDGTLARLEQYSSEEKEFIQNEDMDKFSALFGAWSQWNPVAPEELQGKVSIYSGTLDFNKEAVEIVTRRQKEFQSFGVCTQCFEGLNHQELITKREICQSWVLQQLNIH